MKQKNTIFGETPIELCLSLEEKSFVPFDKNHFADRHLTYTTFGLHSNEHVTQLTSVFILYQLVQCLSGKWFLTKWRVTDKKQSKMASVSKMNSVEKGATLSLTRIIILTIRCR